LRISAELKNLYTIRNFVEEQALALDAAPPAVADMLLAVDEAATNIIVHGYRGRPGAIEIQVSRRGHDLVVRLRDQADPFDPNRVPPPDLSRPLEERPVGGLGIYLMAQLVDRIDHRVTPEGGNELILVKKNSIPGLGTPAGQRER
jgi:serine/threonine-protein kinase RsbW